MRRHFSALLFAVTSRFSCEGIKSALDGCVIAMLAALRGSARRAV
jgi:hypothetical protein